MKIRLSLRNTGAVVFAGLSGNIFTGVSRLYRSIASEEVFVSVLRATASPRTKASPQLIR